MKKFKNASLPFTVMFIVLLALKLTGIIDWSWWIITAPIWIPVFMVPIFLLLLYLILFFARSIKTTISMGRRIKKVPTDSRKDRPCNNGDIRLCQVCIYNDDCPYQTE